MAARLRDALQPLLCDPVSVGGRTAPVSAGTPHRLRRGFPRAGGAAGPGSSVNRSRPDTR